MRSFSKHTKQATEDFGRDSYSEVNFSLPVEQRWELSLEDATSVYGGIRTSPLPFSPKAFRNFSDPIADEPTSRWSPSVQAFLDQPHPHFQPRGRLCEARNSGYKSS